MCVRVGEDRYAGGALALALGLGSTTHGDGVRRPDVCARWRLSWKRFPLAALRLSFADRGGVRCPTGTPSLGKLSGSLDVFAPNPEISTTDDQSFHDERERSARVAGGTRDAPARSRAGAASSQGSQKTARVDRVRL